MVDQYTYISVRVECFECVNYAPWTQLEESLVASFIVERYKGGNSMLEAIYASAQYAWTDDSLARCSHISQHNMSEK